MYLCLLLPGRSNLLLQQQVGWTKKSESKCTKANFSIRVALLPPFSAFIYAMTPSWLFFVDRRNVDFFERCHTTATKAVDAAHGNGEITVKLPAEAHLILNGQWLDYHRYSSLLRAIR